MKRLGAYYLGEGECEFAVWAPLPNRLSLHILSPSSRIIPMERDPSGYSRVVVENISPGTRYFYLLHDKTDRPDPASFYQPDGVFGPSCVVDHHEFQWDERNWPGIPLDELVIYELHIGTFTLRGTFESAVDKLEHLVDLGINAIEIMPVAQFSGDRNWGYDGVFPFAAQNSYGGPTGLKSFINACHAKGIAVILDVVHNHLGPEGNFAPEFMPCFADEYRSPWGKAINLDGAYSDGVRDFFIQSALCWLGHYHIDGLRLDAIHGIHDMSAKHFLTELAESVREFSKQNGRKRYLIAESDLNDARIVASPANGGYGIDAQWNDDFHHCLHALLTKEKQAYYEDFGDISQMAKALTEGFVYSWDYSAFRKKYHGSSSADIRASQFVVFSQNHDQVGNRMKGERMPTLVNFEALKVAAGMVFLSGNIPLLFMGEEYGECAPFLYFVSFQDEKLARDICESRRRELLALGWTGEPDDPHDTNTFLKSKLRWDNANEASSRILSGFYKKLIQVRKQLPGLNCAGKAALQVSVGDQNQVLSILRRHGDNGIYAVFNFSGKETTHHSDQLDGVWRKTLDSSEASWFGPGSELPQSINTESELSLEPYGMVVYQREL